eukprot:TRINITY_DN1764_c0_g2_i1.p1 TRINITY_DN1764_c0_g2~~TRINITY_DN1764_c0_g2_i1.p1  ORF type:complete len:564 (-),score=74.63 TRINITY_DN1764_c0_g2_i1:515-2176(-)
MSLTDEEVVTPLIKEYTPPLTLKQRISRSIYGDPPQSLKQRFKLFVSGKAGLLALYLILVILIGTGNRVTFKLMQFALTNYSYFVSQLTTFIYVPVSFAIIWFKFSFTNDITPEMTKFPKYRFAVMGLLDSLQGLLITVGGNYVPGIMQSLLLQGSVPMTMLCSILILRPKGCLKCQKLFNILESERVRYKLGSTLPATCTDSKCLARISVDGREILGWQSLNEKNPADLSLFYAKASLHSASDVQVVTSARPWGTHLKTFYSLTQYIGAAVILAGLVVSVWPALSDSGGGQFQWDLIFFAATIPTALSAVYKEIAFREIEDMDVWYLNGWVALYQFYFGLFYAPLAAVMSDLAIRDIPSNLWNGFLCFLLSSNFITPDDGCSAASDCGPPSNPTCCDSCDGSLPNVSSLRAIYGVLLYMAFNLSYNILLVLVIKYGSAALMYVASTIVLPLGLVAFTIPALMGSHAQPFTKWNGAGLAVVLFGLVIYRFFAFKKKDQPTPFAEGDKVVLSEASTPCSSPPTQLKAPNIQLTSPVDNQLNSSSKRGGIPTSSS